MSPLLAQSGHHATEFQCPLLGVKRAWPKHSSMSAFDPKRTYALQQAAAYSITSLARASMVAGIVRPSRFGSLEIDYQIEFGRVLHRQIARLLRLSVYD